jgi:hypothetical protein
MGQSLVLITAFKKKKSWTPPSKDRRNSFVFYHLTALFTRTYDEASNVLMEKRRMTNRPTTPRRPLHASNRCAPIISTVRQKPRGLNHRLSTLRSLERDPHSDPCSGPVTHAIQSLPSAPDSISIKERHLSDRRSSHVFGIRLWWYNRRSNRAQRRMARRTRGARGHTPAKG